MRTRASVIVIVAAFGLAFVSLVARPPLRERLTRRARVSFCVRYPESGLSLGRI